MSTRRPSANISTQKALCLIALALRGAGRHLRGGSAVTVCVVASMSRGGVYRPTRRRREAGGGSRDRKEEASERIARLHRSAALRRRRSSTAHDAPSALRARANTADNVGKGKAGGGRKIKARQRPLATAWAVRRDQLNSHPASTGSASWRATSRARSQADSTHAAK
eukprot:scaffold109627_cov33-Tisochrysis_lutea.AAC.1